MPREPEEEIDFVSFGGGGGISQTDNLLMSNIEEHNLISTDVYNSRITPNRSPNRSPNQKVTFEQCV